MEKDPEFLKDLFSETQASMRFRSEREYKLLRIFMIVAPLVITASVSLHKYVEDVGVYVVCNAALAFLLTSLSYLIADKIQSEHETYRDMGQQTVRIWKYFRLFEKGAYLSEEQILPEHAAKYGTGKGHREVIRIIWTIAIFLDIVMAALLILKAWPKAV